MSALAAREQRRAERRFRDDARRVAEGVLTVLAVLSLVGAAWVAEPGTGWTWAAGTAAVWALTMGAQHALHLWCAEPAPACVVPDPLDRSDFA